MINAIIVTNNQVTAIINGVIHSGTLDTHQVSQLSKDMDELTLIKWLNPKLQEVYDHNNQLQLFEEVGKSEDSPFELKDGLYYRKGLPYALPKMLLEEYSKCYKSNSSYQHLNNFWIKCCLNPDPIVRENLFWFLNKNGFNIATNGDFVAYRNAKLFQEGNKELHDFIVNQYQLVKYKWKKSPNNYIVHEADDGSYFMDKKLWTEKKLGTLDYMFNNLSKETETIYTDAHSGTTRITIGNPVSIDRSKCDPNPNNLCSRGLHVASSSWLNKGYFGDVSLICLVNPMNVVCVPKEDHYGKMRVCEYLPIGFYERNEEGNIVVPDTTLFEEQNDELAIDYLNATFDTPHKIEKLEIKELDIELFKDIEEYQKTLKDKVNYV